MLCNVETRLPISSLYYETAWLSSRDDMFPTITSAPGSMEQFHHKLYFTSQWLGHMQVRVLMSQGPDSI